MNNNKTKKIILFIVEGVTDKNSLGLVLSRLVNSGEVRFEVTNGDVTTQNRTDCASIVSKVVNNFLKRSRFMRSDIMRIVQIIDTDGAFIPDDNIIEMEDVGTHYGMNTIQTSYYDETIARVHSKRNTVGQLCKLNKIGNIPYSIYYFSRNLEHVLHDIEGDISSKRKVYLAEQFQDEYYDEPELFIKLLESQAIKVEGGYNKSWDYIFTGSNSLKRCSNFYLFFKSKGI